MAPNGSKIWFSFILNWTHRLHFQKWLQVSQQRVVFFTVLLWTAPLDQNLSVTFEYNVQIHISAAYFLRSVMFSIYLEENLKSKSLQWLSLILKVKCWESLLSCIFCATMVPLPKGQGMAMYQQTVLRWMPAQNCTVRNLQPEPTKTCYCSNLLDIFGNHWSW